MTSMQRDDAGELALLRGGDEAAFARLVRAHHRALLALARPIVGESEAAEVVQTAWIKAHAALKDFEGRAALRSWLSRIVINEAEKQVIGIMVDSVAEVVYLRSSEIDAAPAVGTEESAKFIQGVSNRDGQLLILVDLNKLLSDEEWDDIGSL